MQNMDMILISATYLMNGNTTKTKTFSPTETDVSHQNSQGQNLLLLNTPSWKSLKILSNLLWVLNNKAHNYFRGGVPRSRLAMKKGTFF